MTTASSGLIELRLNNVGQLFNTMDPSPFHERDLDHDAEEFILSWAREHERDSVLRIRVVLRQPADPEAARLVEESIRHYFEYRARISRRELGELFREGRSALLPRPPVNTASGARPRPGTARASTPSQDLSARTSTPF